MELPQKKIADVQPGQERGEVRRPNNEKTASSEEAVSASDLHLTHKQIHEARQIRAFLFNCRPTTL